MLDLFQVRAGVSLLIAPRFSASVLEFTLVDERVASLFPHFGVQVLTGPDCTYLPNSGSVYPPFLEFLEQVLERSPTGGSSVLLGDFNAHKGNDN